MEDRRLKKIVFFWTLGLAQTKICEVYPQYTNPEAENKNRFTRGSELKRRVSSMLGSRPGKMERLKVKK